MKKKNEMKMKMNQGKIVAKDKQVQIGW